MTRQNLAERELELRRALNFPSVTLFPHTTLLVPVDLASMNR